MPFPLPEQLICNRLSVNHEDTPSTTLLDAITSLGELTLFFYVERIHRLNSKLKVLMCAHSGVMVRVVS